MTCPVVMLNCQLGLYKIFWKEEQGGNVSLAAIGMSREGERWFAPTNWSNVGLLKDSVESIARMELVIDHKDRNNVEY